MDTTYQNQLRELNDLNWERFKAELHGESKAIRSELRSELRSEVNSLRSELRAEIATLGSDLRREMEAGFAQLRLEMAQFQSNMMKWMFVYWTGTMAVVLYAMLGR